MNTIEYRQATARGIEAALQSVDSEKIAAFVKEMENANRIFFSGAGRSLLMVKAFAMAMMQIGFTVYVTGEVCTPSIQEGDLLVVASCSGETKSVQLFVEEAKQMGAKIVLLTGRAESTIAKASDLVLTMNYKSEPGSVQESWIVDNRFEQSIVPLGDCIVEYLGRSKCISGKTISENHANLE